MDPLEVLTDAPPKQARNAATAPEAAAWLRNPSAPLTEAASAKFVTQLELELDQSAPLCRSCGNITQRSGSCHTCPCCGTSNGCA